MNLSDFKIKTIKNIGFNTISTLAKFVLSACASIVLAQKLSPADYGIVGFAMIFINFMSNFGDLGISQAAIQKNQLDERGLYTAYTAKFVLGISIFALIFLLSPLARHLFDKEAVVLVIKILSLGFIVSTFSFLPICLLTRELNYKKLIIPQLISALTNSGLSILLALLNFNYWSIVSANLASGVISALVINTIHPVKIKFMVDKALFKEFIRFGSNLFYSGLIVYIIFNADNFFIGTLLGSSMLGLYAVAFNWGSMISGRLYEVVHSVLFPTFSRMQNDKTQLKESYLKVLEYITFIGVIANLALFLCAREFLFYILGHSTMKWMPALLTFQIMLVYGVIRTILEPIGNVFMALGKTEWLLRSNLLAGAIELALIYPTIKLFGIEGVAVLVTLSYTVQYFVYFPVLKKEINLELHDIWPFAKPTLLSVFFITALVSFSKYFMDTSLSSFIFKLFLIVVGYSLFYNAITKWKLLKEATGIINNIVFTRKIVC